MPKSYRIRTQVGVDKSVKVNLEQDFDSIRGGGQLGEFEE